MALSKTAGTWEDLQESLTRVRKQYGLLPRAGWDDLIAMVSYEKAISAKQRNKNLARPFLPSLTDDIPKLNADHRKDDKKYTNPVLNNQNTSKRIAKGDLVFRKHVLQKDTEWRKTKPNIDQGLNGYLTENQHFVWDFVESLVYEILRDEILPDVVIEALTSNPSKIAVMPRKKYYGPKLSESWISERGLLTSISQNVLDELLNELLKELSNHVLKVKVQDFVGDYLMKTTLHDFMDDLLTSVIQTELLSLVEELNKETEYDKWSDNLIQSLIDTEVRDVVTTVLTESDDHFSILLKNQIAVTANKHIVDMFMLDDLLGLIGTHEPLIFEKDSSGCLLDSIILDVLMKEYATIQQLQQATFENCPAKHFHQNMFNEVALDVILTELNMLLVEDMEDIFEYEQDIELG